MSITPQWSQCIITGEEKRQERRSDVRRSQLVFGTLRRETVQSNSGDALKPWNGLVENVYPW